MRNILSRLVVVAALLWAAAGGAAELSGILETAAQKAARLYEEKKWGELERFTLESAELREEDKGAALFYHGIALYHSGKGDNAIAALVNALPLLEKNDRKNEALNAVAAAYVNKKEWKLAIAYYRQSLALEDAQPEVWDNLWVAFLGLHEGENAPTAPTAEVRREKIDILGSRLRFKTNYDDVALWRQYAALLLAEGQREEAKTAYRHIVRLQPEDKAALEWLFVHAVAAGSPESVAAYESRLLNLNPRHPMVFLQRAERALTAGHAERAARLFETAAADGAYPLVQAQALTGLGRLASSPTEALDFYLRAIKSEPSYLPGWEGAVIVYRNQNNKEKERAYFSRMRLIKNRLDKGEAITRDLLANL